MNWLVVAIVLASGCDFIWRIDHFDRDGGAAFDGPGDIQPPGLDTNDALVCGTHDEDGDGVNDGCDNCPVTTNAGQGNADGDQVGTICDPQLAASGHDTLAFFDAFVNLNAFTLGGAPINNDQETVILGPNESLTTSTVIQRPTRVEVRVTSATAVGTSDFRVELGPTMVACRLSNKNCAGGPVGSLCLELLLSGSAVSSVQVTAAVFSGLQQLVIERLSPTSTLCTAKMASGNFETPGDVSFIDSQLKLEVGGTATIRLPNVIAYGE